MYVLERPKYSAWVLQLQACILQPCLDWLETVHPSVGALARPGQAQAAVNGGMCIMCACASSVANGCMDLYGFTQASQVACANANAALLT